MTTTEAGTEGVARDLVHALEAKAVSNDTVADWAEQLDHMAHQTLFERGEVLVEHHAVAEYVHFLLEGKIAYQHLVAGPDEAEIISHEQFPWMPIGWSSLRFHRYRVTVVAETDGRLLTLPISAIEQLSVGQPLLWAHLAEFIFRTSTQMLGKARGRNTQADRPVGDVAAEVMTPVDKEAAEIAEIYRQSPCFSALTEDCRAWLTEHSQLYQVEAGTEVIGEGAPSQGLWLLQSGRVALRYGLTTGDGDKTAVRHAVRPGTLLCWSALAAPLSAPYQIETTRRTTLAFVPRHAIADLMTREPRWVGAIFEQQLWQLRGFLLSTRIQYGAQAEDGGVNSLADLIEDNKPILPVDSTLYGVPRMLRSKLTRESGFRELYRLLLRGTENERATAGVSLDLLSDLERGHRFYLGLLSTYAAVVRNQHLAPTQLREISSHYFKKALSHVPYVIRGLENLPDDPNCIFIYNHMAYAEDSILPNGFLFNPDSHFLSSMIMEPKYGDGIRISRSNAATEFWRADYYERQGHIQVTTPESGWLKETPEEKQRRKDDFFADCQAVLDSGLPFSIAPEGTITEQDSVTERSPGPLKAGAFLMSGRFPTKPKLVPVAFANIDKPAWRAVFSCVVKPAFSMEERGVDLDDRESLGRFLETYRHEFRGHVEEAIELAKQLQAPEPNLTGVLTNLADVDAVSEEFEFDVRELEFTAPVGRAATVFYGSSTIRQWDNLQIDVGITDAVNLGFGGSTLEACRHYFDRLVLPHKPERLILYAGENDIAHGASAETVSEQFRQLADIIQTELPQTRCWFLSIKPSPGREQYVGEFSRANDLIASEIESRERWRYIDWFSPLLDHKGKPRADLFRPDQVHLNRAGYALLTELVRRELGTLD